jgi:hypothetical protein
MQFLDKYGWPVERVQGRPVLNLIRLFLHTRKIVRRWEHGSPYAACVEGMAETDAQEMMMSSTSLCEAPDD